MYDHWTGLLEHIEDLRQTLIKSLIIIAAGFVLLLCFYQPLFQFFLVHSFSETDKGWAKEEVKRVRLTNLLNTDQEFHIPPGGEIVSSEALNSGRGSDFVVLAPGESVVYEETVQSPFLILGPMEGMTLLFKMCFWLSVALTAPAWGWVLLQFVLPGLQEREKWFLIPFLGLSVIFMGGGALFAYLFTLPLANAFFFEFNRSLAQNAWTIGHYIDYVLLLCLGHAIAAELALLLFALVHFGVLTAEWLVAKRRMMIVMAFVLGALLTPPDIFSQLLLAIPLVAVNEAVILYAKWIASKEKEAVSQKMN